MLWELITIHESKKKTNKQTKCLLLIQKDNSL